MRVLHICQRDDPDTGGALRVAEALVREQRLDGCEAWMLFLYGPPAGIASQFAPQVHCLELDSSRQAWRGVAALRKAIRRIAPDIIHSHDGILWPHLAFMWLGIPLVMHTHLPAAQPVNPKLWLGLMLIKKTTRQLVGISRHTIGTWVAAGYPPSQIRYVPNGVDFGRFGIVGGEAQAVLRRRLGLPMEKRILLWVGRLHRSMKGSDRVERVAGMLPPDTVLAVVGNGPEYSGMVARCARLIEGGSLVMCGSTSTPEDYYNAADAFLFTSYHEPFGLVILEAVACGLPILAFPVTLGGGAAELLREFGATMLHDDAPSGQTERTVAAVLEQAGAGTVRRDQAKAAYSWTQLSRQVVAVYESMLKEPARAAGPRILHICQRDDLSTGGATRIAFDLVVGQRGCGVESHLLFLYGKPGELGRHLQYQDVHYLDLSSAEEVQSKGWRIRRVVRKLDPDMVHHHDMLSWPQLFNLLPHRYRTVYHAHLDHHPPVGLKARIAWWLVRRNAEMIITPSSYGRECLLEAGVPDRRIAVVPNGTQLLGSAVHQANSYLRDRYAPGSRSILMGWGGRLHCETKGTDDFIRLFNHLPEDFIGIIAGHGPDEAMLKKLVGECGLEGRVFFHGLECDMRRFYRGLDGFVLTSHFESFGLVVIEALANHVPVFSFPVEGGISDLLRLPGVSVCLGRSLVAMADLIRSGFSDGDVMSRLVGEGEREVRRRYSIERMATETLGLYGRMEKG